MTKQLIAKLNTQSFWKNYIKNAKYTLKFVSVFTDQEVKKMAVIITWGFAHERDRRHQSAHIFVLNGVYQQSLCNAVIIHQHALINSWYDNIYCCNFPIKHLGTKNTKLKYVDAVSSSPLDQKIDLIP